MSLMRLTIAERVLCTRQKPLLLENWRLLTLTFVVAVCWHKFAACQSISSMLVKCVTKITDTHNRHIILSKISICFITLWGHTHVCRTWIKCVFGVVAICAWYIFLVIQNMFCICNIKVFGKRKLKISFFSKKLEKETQDSGSTRRKWTETLETSSIIVLLGKKHSFACFLHQIHDRDKCQIYISRTHVPVGNLFLLRSVARKGSTGGAIQR